MAKDLLKNVLKDFGAYEADRKELMIQSLAEDGHLGPEALFIRKRGRTKERLDRNIKEARASRLANWTRKMKTFGFIVDSSETAFKDTAAGLEEVHSFDKEEAGIFYKPDVILKFDPVTGKRVKPINERVKEIKQNQPGTDEYATKGTNAGPKKINKKVTTNKEKPTERKEAAGLEVRLQEELKALKDQQRSSIYYRRGGVGAEQTLKIMRKEQDLHRAKNPDKKFPSFYGG